MNYVHFPGRRQAYRYVCTKCSLARSWKFHNFWGGRCIYLDEQGKLTWIYAHTQFVYVIHKIIMWQTSSICMSFLSFPPGATHSLTSLEVHLEQPSCCLVTSCCISSHFVIKKLSCSIHFIALSTADYRVITGCHVHVDNLLTVCWQIQFQIRQACNKVVNMVVVCLYADNLVTNLLQLADRFNFRTLTDLSQPCDNLAISIWKPERLRYIQFNFFLPSYQLSPGSNE